LAHTAQDAAREKTERSAAFIAWTVFAILSALLGAGIAAGKQQAGDQAVLPAKKDRSELTVVAADVQLLLIVPSGKKTGYDAGTRKQLRAIPDSAYDQDALPAYDSGRADTSTTQRIDVRHPAAGKYRLIVSAGTLADGREYEVRITLYGRDGSEARSVRVTGTAARDKPASYELRISTRPGHVAILSRPASAAGAR
jgi:hypothetical protein